METKVIESTAPVRICDIGGWTDTWFGGPGRVLNIAVAPGAHVTIRASDEAGPVVIDAADIGARYEMVPGRPGVVAHGLIEAALDALPPPPGPAVEIGVRSAVPPGSGTGSSAAVSVAVLGALAALRGERWSPSQLASLAHRLEVEVLGLESGVQDQISAASGGINYIEIDAYPRATVTPLGPWDELGRRLSLVYLGGSHHSSEIHRRVIKEARGARAGSLARLREAAAAARHAVGARDLEGFGRAMIANTEAQESLQPELVGSDARRVIGAAAARGALGWKVNGAGGEGGSLTLLSRGQEEKAAIERAITSLGADYRVIPVRVSPAGLTVCSAPAG